MKIREKELKRINESEIKKRSVELGEEVSRGIKHGKLFNYI